MAVAVSAMAPSCLPSLHGPSRLSRASAVDMPPLLADAEDTTLLTDEEFKALMCGHCDLPSLSEPCLHSPLLFSSEESSLPRQAQLLCKDDAQFRAPPFSLDSVLHAPISEDDVDLLAPLFSQEEVHALCAARQASPESAGSRSGHQAAGEKRKSTPWPSCMSDDDDDAMEEAEPPPPPPVKRVRTKRISRRKDRAPATRRQLREWHHTVATRILWRRFRAPELSRGRTLLGCQCLELSLADAGVPRGGCALHQDGGDRAWMYSAQGRVPLVGGPGEVLVPTVAAGNSRAMVQDYARWRRSVCMPTRFYVERAAQQGRPAPPHRHADDDWMMA